MTRMHTKDKGKSGSTHPASKEPPTWAELSEDEVREKIEELREKGNSPSDIGRILRDQYGVPDVKAITGEKITQILEKQGGEMEYPEDLMNLMRKAVRIRKHLKKGNKDNKNKRSLKLTESKIRKLVRYYKKKGKIEDDWYYKPEKAKLIVEE
ncbi:MAG: 30S ribosomal protein S15 [archaeon]